MTTDVAPAGTVRVRITFPDGSTRNGFHDASRSMVLWREAEPHPEDGDNWYWAHAHESQVVFDERNAE